MRPERTTRWAKKRGGSRPPSLTGSALPLVRRMSTTRSAKAAAGADRAVVDALFADAQAALGAFGIGGSSGIGLSDARPGR